MKNPNSICGLFAFPGFAPTPRMVTVFGDDRHARIMKLRWRKKRLSARIVVTGTRRALMVIKASIRLFCAVFVYLYMATVCADQAWPAGISFAGFIDGEWKIYYVRAGTNTLQEISTQTEPRTPVFAASTGRLAFIGAEGTLREYILDEKKEVVRLKPSKASAFTQPAYGVDGKSLYVVELKKGASVDTDILLAGLTTDAQRKPVVTQRSAQFEPYLTDREMYYSSVHCTVGCGRIIQEIWGMNLVTKEARQVTLTNHIARQPALSANNHWLYFSSNIDGHYHIWRKNLVGSGIEKITDGMVTDESPALDRDGSLYYIRRTEDGVSLRKLFANGKKQEMILPQKLLDLRNLEISR